MLIALKMADGTTDNNAELEKIKYICKNKKNVSHIQEYLVKLEQGTEFEILEALPILTGVFSFYIKKGTWNVIPYDSESDSTANSVVKVDANGIDNCSQIQRNADKKVNSWLCAGYKALTSLLFQYIFQNSTSVQLPCLKSLLNLMQAEHSARLLEYANSAKTGKLAFPHHIFMKLVKQFLITRRVPKEVFEHLKSLIHEYDDLSYYWLKNIKTLLEKLHIIEKYDSELAFIPNNVFEILSVISKKSFDSESDLNLFVHCDHSNESLEIKKSYRHAFSSAWMALLCISNLPKVIQKKILVDIDSKIMPKLVDPKLLIDFLTDSYDAGGVCSLLALNGLFVLINQFNLDYPEFYSKLYVLLDVAILHTKYKARFFFLLDLFLSSSHLPSYLVCAFIKKLARMTLFTPGEDMVIMLKFIRNLLIKHPSSRILIHRKNLNDEEKMIVDPFIPEEGDPFKCNASKSCLWELESLRSHYSKDVRKVLLSFRKEFPLVEDDITDYMDIDFESLIKPKLDAEINEGKLPPFNFELKTEIISLDSDMWCS